MSRRVMGSVMVISVRNPLLMLALAASALSLPSLAETAGEPLPEGYHGVADDKVKSLKELCHATAATGLFAGAVLVADAGEIIYEEAFGLANREWNIPNTTDTKFRLGSVSKQFCSMLVMQLVEEGEIQLDDTITEHLSYYRKDTGDKVTIHHLLSHQSGIRDFTTGYDYRGTVSRLSHDKDDFIRDHCSGDLIHDPGTLYAYCNAGYCILGRIIEKITRKSFEQNLKERIFEPLGMKNSGYDRNRYILEKRASGYTRGPFEYTHADYLDMDSSPEPAAPSTRPFRTCFSGIARSTRTPSSGARTATSCSRPTATCPKSKPPVVGPTAATDMAGRSTPARIR
jgi:CubicO group peptidase (beta-lactamase class C family)